MGEEKFSLPISSYKEIVRLIIAYSRLRSPLSLAEFAKVAGVNADTVTRNNPFLSDAGIITRTVKKITTAEGKDLGLALEHGVADATAAAWKKIADRTEIFHRFVDFVKNRGQVDGDALYAQICLITNSPKSARALTGAATIVNILLAAGVIQEIEKGKYKAGAPQESASASTKPANGSARGKEAEGSAEEDSNRGGRVAERPLQSSPSLNINLQIHISADATVEQIEKIFESMAKYLYKPK
jgi:hypothetical protein